MSDELEPKLLADLLAMIAHDLRNPLSALGSNVGFIGSLIDESDADAQEALRDSVVSCEGLLHIIDNVDLLGHALGGGRVPGRSPVAVVPLVTEVVKKAESTAASHGARLELTIGPGADKCQVVANRDMMLRALSNLVRNGIQHGAGEAPVRVSVTVDGPDARVAIVDAGPPLDAALGDNAFSAAGQLVSKGLAAGRYSRGLGLYAARVAADATGARLTAGQTDKGESLLSLLVPVAPRAPVTAGG